MPDQTADHLSGAVEAVLVTCFGYAVGTQRAKVREMLEVAEPFVATYYEDKGAEKLWARARQQRSAIGERGFAVISSIFADGFEEVPR